MRQIRIVGLCLLAALVYGAQCVASASAAAPEIGRCIAHKGGKFKEAGCKTEAKVATEEKFEWYPGDGSESPKTKEAKPILKKHFTTKIKEGTGLAKLETVHGVVVTCVNQTGEGEFTSVKTLSVTNVVFTGCESNAFQCNSTNPKAANIGEIRVVPLVGLIGIEKIGLLNGKEDPAKDKLANELSPAEGTVFTEFECGPAKAKVIGHVLSPITNKMLSSMTVKFTATKANKNPKNSQVEKKLILESSISGGPFEQAGQTLTTVQEGEEKAEVSSVN